MGQQHLKIREGSIEEALSSRYVNYHWDELCKRKELFKLNPDYKTYFKLEDTDHLLTIILENNKEIVGYSVNIITNHLHYKDVIICQNDLLYLKEEYRQGFTGIKLIKETEKLAKLKGAGVMLWHAKVDSNLAKILPKMKANLHEQIYLKEL